MLERRKKNGGREEKLRRKKAGRRLVEEQGANPADPPPCRAENSGKEAGPTPELDGGDIEKTEADRAGGRSYGTHRQKRSRGGSGSSTVGEKPRRMKMHEKEEKLYKGWEKKTCLAKKRKGRR